MKLSEPIDVGFSEARINRIDSRMNSYVEDRKLAGIVTLVAREDRVVHFKTFGLQDIAAGISMKPDTIFRIFSMTKPITCVALMMLYEQGLFRLGDPIHEFIPAFKEVKVYDSNGSYRELERPISIHHLLTHRAGMVYAYEGTGPVHQVYRELDLWNPANTNQELVNRITSAPLICQPGSLWTYGVATDVVGHLVEILSGMTLGDFFSEYIFKPFGMEDTGFKVPLEKADRFAALYGPDETHGLSLISTSEGGEYVNVQTEAGGGGLVSTAADYLRFAQSLLNKGVYKGVRMLGRKTIELMTQNHVPLAQIPTDVAGGGYGLGLGILLDPARMGILGSVGSYGWGGAAETEFWVDPEERLIGIFLAQFMPPGTYPVAADFRSLVYQAIID